MAAVDIILGIPLAWAIYHGFRKGLILELAMLVGLVAGVYIGLHFSKFAADLIRDNLHLNGAYLPVLSFAVVFLMVMFGVYILGKILEKFAEALLLGFFNKIFGALFGLLRMAVMLSFILLILNSFSRDHEIISKEQQARSYLYKPVSSIAGWLMPKIKVEDLKKEVLPVV